MTKYFVTYTLCGSSETCEYDSAEEAARLVAEFTLDILEVGACHDECMITFNKEDLEDDSNI